METTRREAALVDMLAAVHHRLVERARGARGPSPEAVLDLGAAVLFHGAAEQALPLNPLVDPEVEADFRTEHARLAEDLTLLDSLWMADPGSSDVQLLAAALFERLRDHLARDDRVFYRAVARTGA